MSEQRILITGGAGFIGSRTARALVEREGQTQPVRVWVFDSLHPQVHGVDAQPPALIDHPQITFVRADVCARAAVQSVLAAANPTTIIHMAAETGTGQSMSEIHRYCEANVSGTAILLEEITKAQPQTNSPLQRFILMSSRAVYGEGAYWDEQRDRLVVPPPREAIAMNNGQFSPQLPDAPNAPLKPIPTPEDTPPAPSSIYASTKLMQEHLVTQAGATEPWQALLFRFQNVYGPGQSLKNPYTGVLSIFSSQILQGKTLNIYEDGQIGRDFVFVDDVVSALVSAAGANLPHGTVINIGSGAQTTILEAAQLLLKLYDADTNRYEITGDFRAGDIRHAVADISRAKSLLGWQPQVTLESGLSQLAQWCRSAAGRTCQ